MIAATAKPPRHPRPPRQAVLVVAEPDGFISIFSDSNVDVHIANIPQSSRGCEGMAEEVAEMLMPPRFRAHFRADRIRAVGTARPLKPSALLAARQVAVDVATLNSLSRKGQQK